MPTTAKTVEIADWFLAGHAALQERSADPAWLRTLRSRGADLFRRQGLPTSRLEDWKHTDVSALARMAFRAPDENAAISRRDVEPFALDQTHQMVFVDGRHRPELSDAAAPKGVGMTTFREAAAGKDGLEPLLGRLASPESQPFVALNTAHLDDGAFIDVAKGTLLERPLHLLFVTTAAKEPTFTHPRVVLRFGAASNARVVETHASLGGTRFTNAVTEVVADEGAVVQHVKVQRETESSFHFHTVEIRQARATNVDSFNAAIGGALVRNDINQRFDAEGGELTLDGLYLGHGRQHTDNHTRIDHAQPHCTSREFYKGLLDDTARAVFYGKVLVRAGAVKTNASQQNKNLLLSKGALVDSIPALEILCNDVKCSHGSSIGQLSQDSLFYLRSRGVDETAARSLLVYGFAREIIDRVKIPQLRSKLNDILLSRLPNGSVVREVLNEA